MYGAATTVGVVLETAATVVADRLIQTVQEARWATVIIFSVEQMLSKLGPLRTVPLPVAT